MDVVNGRKVLLEDSIHRDAPEGALFLASSKKEVDTINKEAFGYLRGTLNREHITIWAYHTIGKRGGEFDLSARINALSKCPAENSDQYHKWLGVGRNRMRLAIGSRVRYLLNRCPMAALYQGSLGKCNLRLLIFSSLSIS